MKRLIAILALSVMAITAFTQDETVDEHPMRVALIRWHEFYHVEIAKCATNNPAVGLCLTGSMEMMANTRLMQLNYFDRKVCRLFAAISNAPTASNFVWQVGEWTTKPLPNHP